MQSQSISWKSISKFLTWSALAVTLTGGGIALVLGSPNIASAETREQSVDSVTDWLFGNVNPHLNRRKLRSHESEYIREWYAIRSVIDQGGLGYKKVDSNIRGCGKPDWTFPNNDELLKERLADAVFYSRYPERRGRPISPNDRAAIREWLKLKNSMSVAYC